MDASQRGARNFRLDLECFMVCENNLYMFIGLGIIGTFDFSSLGGQKICVAKGGGRKFFDPSRRGANNFGF